MLLYPSRPVLDVSDLCQDTQPSRGQPSFRVLPASYSSRRAQRDEAPPAVSVVATAIADPRLTLNAASHRRSLRGGS